MQRYTLTLAFVVSALGSDPRQIWSHADGHIVGGKATTIDQHPHQVSLEVTFWGNLFMHICGGSIIDKEWILTAAHCITEYSTNNVRIRVGSSQVERFGKIHTISGVIIHPKYDYRGDYDVALLKVQKPFRLSENIQPITMVDKTPPVNSQVITTGWGYKKHEKQISKLLQEVELKILDKDECYQVNKVLIPVSASTICAGDPEGGKDTCQGDSGGPLVYEEKLAGIVSWGLECAKPGYPGVYVDVAHVRNWIFSQTGVYSSRL